MWKKEFLGNLKTVTKNVCQKSSKERCSKAKANDVSAGFHANFHIWPLKFVEGISHGEICASLTVPLKKKVI